MQSGDERKPECPVGESDCERLDELEAMAKLVHTDPLTGLFNYRHFALLMEQELERTRRNGQPLSLVMLDLDHFKRVNDEWGHEVGNRVLVHCAGLMTQVLRKVDSACRYGGEEFALVLPGTELPRAVGAAERLRQAIENTPVAVDGGELRVTASMGADVCAKGDQLDLESFVARADAFLYEAKSQGRNRVCHRDFETLRPKGQVSRQEKDDLFGP